MTASFTFHLQSNTRKGAERENIRQKINSLKDRATELEIRAYKNGVLELELPKKVPARPQARQIELK